MAQRHAACKQEEEACFQQSISNHYEDYEETFTKTFGAASVYHRVLGSTLFILCGVSHRMTIDWVIITRAIIFLIFLPAGRYYSCQWLIWVLCVSNLCVCVCTRVCACVHACIWVYGSVGMGGACICVLVKSERQPWMLFLRNCSPCCCFVVALFVIFLFFWNSISCCGSGWLGTPYVDRLASDS